MANEKLEISALFDPEEEGGTVFIFGGPSAIDHLATLLTTVTKEVSYQLSAPPDRFVEEADIVLQQLTLLSQKQPVSIKRVDKTLSISGDEINLWNIAYLLRSLGDAAINKQFYTHNHIDHFGDPDGITADSTPMIVRALTDEELNDIR